MKQTANPWAVCVTLCNTYATRLEQKLYTESCPTGNAKSVKSMPCMVSPYATPVFMLHGNT